MIGETVIDCRLDVSSQYYLVSGSADNTIKIWNTNTGNEIRTLKGHKSWVRCLVVLPNGEIKTILINKNFTFIEYIFFFK